MGAINSKFQSMNQYVEYTILKIEKVSTNANTSLEYRAGTPQLTGYQYGFKTYGSIMSRHYPNGTFNAYVPLYPIYTTSSSTYSFSYDVRVKVKLTLKDNQELETKLDIEDYNLIDRIIRAKGEYTFKYYPYYKYCDYGNTYRPITLGSLLMLGSWIPLGLYLILLFKYYTDPEKWRYTFKWGFIPYHDYW